eukprot:SAG31_NODE_635_length_13360_cov_4.229847_4_plen_71_part_00
MPCQSVQCSAEVPPPPSGASVRMHAQVSCMMPMPAVGAAAQVHTYPRTARAYIPVPRAAAPRRGARASAP